MAVALRILGVALTVGEKGVALMVGENLSLKLPLCTRLAVLFQVFLVSLQCELAITYASIVFIDHSRILLDENQR